MMLRDFFLIFVIIGGLALTYHLFSARAERRRLRRLRKQMPAAESIPGPGPSGGTSPR